MNNQDCPDIITLPVKLVRKSVECVPIPDAAIPHHDSKDEKAVRCVYELQLGKALIEAENINTDLHGKGLAEPLIIELQIAPAALASMPPHVFERTIVRAVENDLAEAVLDFSRKLIREASLAPDDTKASARVE